MSVWVLTEITDAPLTDGVCEVAAFSHWLSSVHRWLTRRNFLLSHEIQFGPELKCQKAVCAGSKVSVLRTQNKALKKVQKAAGGLTGELTLGTEWLGVKECSVFDSLPQKANLKKACFQFEPHVNAQTVRGLYISKACFIGMMCQPFRILF